MSPREGGSHPRTAGRRALAVLALLSGVAMILVLGAAGSHSHHGEVGDGSHCVLCQIQGASLQVGAPAPSPAPSPVLLPGPDLPSGAEASEPSHPLPLLPRGPPVRPGLL